MRKETLLMSVIGTLVVAAVIGYAVSVLVVKQRLSDVVGAARVDIAKQGTTLVALSEVMARGGVDDVTESVIKDCPAEERNRFDVLLSGLNQGLPSGQLTELSRLYDRCASFYARRKAVMVARFEREVQVYELLTERLKGLEKATTDEEFHIAQWKELVDLEKSQSTTFENLVNYQGNIIDELQLGRPVGAPELTSLLKEVQEAQQMQAYNALQMGELRSKLSSL